VSGSPGAPQHLAHVAIATRDADALAATFAALGATRGREEIIDDGGLRLLFVHLGAVTLELLEPRDPAHTVAKFIEKRGEGLHHVALAVADLDAALGRCRQAGIAAIDATPRTGAGGHRIAFLHPKSLGGVLLELCEAREPEPGA
jgi:methylmalonyl-CoA epimerase